jgi:hypothetical protein
VSGVEYNLLGDGTSDRAVLWVGRLLQTDIPFAVCTALLTRRSDGWGKVHDVALLFGVADTSVDLTVIRGLTAGYTGGGPADLSSCLALADQAHVRVQVLEIEESEFDSVLNGTASEDFLMNLHVGRGGKRASFDLTDLVRKEDLDAAMRGLGWYRWSRPLRPASLVDRGILTRPWYELFGDHSDLVLLFADIEELLRVKFAEVGSPADHDATGVALVNHAFGGDKGALMWSDVPPTSSVHLGRRAFLEAAFRMMRNPITHGRNIMSSEHQSILDWLIAYRAYGLVHTAVQRPKQAATS